MSHEYRINLGEYRWAKEYRKQRLNDLMIIVGTHAMITLLLLTLLCASMR